MEGLTLRQQEILAHIQRHMREQGTWPSIREIQSHFGFASTNAVMGHLRALVRKEFISRVPGQARTFRISRERLAAQLPDDAVDVVDIPIYGAIAAGYPDRIESGGEIGRLQVDVLTAGNRPNRRVFALKVSGDSMVDAGIFDGDMVVVEPRAPRDNDIVAALIDGETTLKRYIQRGNTPAYLKAENRRYPTLHPVAELTIQGVAKAIVRSL